eukprot:symbB.v1.2.032255.t1/scaffold3848.1/size51340/2
MEEAPKQDSLTPWWKGTMWDFPKDTPKWFADGIPWDTFGEGKPPMVYDPPQWVPGYLPHCLQQINFWSYRSPLCVCPINCVWLCQCCCIRNSEMVSVDTPDEWLSKMITTGFNEKSPEWMRGVFWLCDNNAPSETLFTFNEAKWSDDSKVAQKNYWENFGVPANCFGAITMWGAATFNSTLRIEVAPNDRWINLYGSGPGWIYVDQPEDVFECKNAAVDLYGEKFKPTTELNEMLRVSHTDETLPLSEPNYQYRVRKVAYLDSDQKLVKTEAWDEYVRRAKMPFAEGTAPNCCGFCFCCRSKEDLALGRYHHMNSQLIVRYAPAPKTASKSPPAETIGAQQ